MILAIIASVVFFVGLGMSALVEVLMRIARETKP